MLWLFGTMNIENCSCGWCGLHQTFHTDVGQDMGYFCSLPGDAQQIADFH
jgi:hypothetical protein